MDYRQKILEEASYMFRTYGIRAVTMDMLASRMNISKRTIYEVFRDKEELLGAVLKWMGQKQHEVMFRIFNESENIIEAIFKLMNVMEDHFRKMSPAFQLDMKRFHMHLVENPELVRDLPYYSSNSEILIRGIREGVFREDIDLDITNKCLLEVAKMSNDQEIFPPADYMKKDVLRNFYINYLRGICTPKGLELIDYFEKKDLSGNNG